MKIKAFTLAEVLITLSIIGVVAALTIPSIIVKNQEKQMVVALKKAYNVLSNAYSLSVLQYGEPSTWASGSAPESFEGSMGLMDKLAPNLNVIKRCDATTGCWPKGVYYRFLSGENNNILDDKVTFSSVVLADGMIMLTFLDRADCSRVYGGGNLEHVCGAINIDLNGQKGPNQFGKDFFGFHLTSNGIIPYGGQNDLGASLSNNCRGDRGTGCAAWVIIKENFDYPAVGVGWN